jgi:hypothetical protein
MFKLLVVDCFGEHRQFDVQEWHYLTWRGTSIPSGKTYGEWAWVGRIYE